MDKHLIRCPFCGYSHPTMEDVEMDRDEKGAIIITFEVSCPKCGAMGPYDRFQSADQAADSWNNRFTKEEY